MSGSKKVFTTLGSSNHVPEEREAFDYYATDPKAVEMLLELEQFSPVIWEPACGEGHISKVLQAHGYGDSFHQTFTEEGMAMPRIRLGDKLARFKSLTKSEVQEVKDESIRDTLIDLANYAIMTVLEMDDLKMEGTPNDR
jgi:hypothetical protein